MTTDTDLDLIFKNAAGKKVTLNIEEPKNGVTKAEIDAAMQVVVENNIFNTSGGDIVEAVQGRLRTTTLNPVEAWWNGGRIMETTEVFSFIKDFGFPVVLSWFLLVRMENKLASLTDVIGELSCNIAAMRGDAR